MNPYRRPPGFNIAELVRQTDRMRLVRKKELRTGDTVVVKTNNSMYTIRAEKSGRFLVSGGWFDRKGLGPMETTIAGCTWGGSAIIADAVAAVGQHIEFGNRVVTSPVASFFVIPREVLN